MLLLAKGGSFDPDTVELLRQFLNEAWQSLSSTQQAQLPRLRQCNGFHGWLPPESTTTSASGYGH
jgi:hypothetical protein